MVYNPHKPGRPSHTYQSYLMANTRLVLDVDAQSGDRSHSSHSIPGLTQLLGRLPSDSRKADDNEEWPLLRPMVIPPQYNVPMSGCTISLPG
jgi:hypothetical protein